VSADGDGQEYEEPIVRRPIANVHVQTVSRDDPDPGRNVHVQTVSRDNPGGSVHVNTVPRDDPGGNVHLYTVPRDDPTVIQPKHGEGA
jgi:hypothetical protein